MYIMLNNINIPESLSFFLFYAGLFIIFVSLIIKCLHFMGELPSFKRFMECLPYVAMAGFLIILIAGIMKLLPDDIEFISIGLFILSIYFGFQLIMYLIIGFCSLFIDAYDQGFIGLTLFIVLWLFLAPIMVCISIFLGMIDTIEHEDKQNLENL